MTLHAALPVAALAVAAATPALAADPAGGQAIFGLVGMELAFLEALILIALACLCVPLSRALGLGTVIGYLAAGIVAGIGLPVSFARQPGELLHFAEFGVVLFLFVIGLEFRPARLWEMRGTIFGRGLSQVMACAVLLTLAALLYGLDWRAALIVGLGLALSSTALVMRGIDESGERNSRFGQTAIAVLLFEDLAIVPFLLLVTLLAPTGGEATLADNAWAVAIGIAAIAVLVIVGRYALDPMFRIIARTRTPELMTAAALGVVVFAALIMAAAGLSYAMGAFIAGVMLAESSYRHEIEADIEPFRGLFMGLFFVAVGLSLDQGAVAENWLVILLAVPVTVALKGLGAYTVNRAFGTPHPIALRIAFAMGQHGEFGFVLFSAASSALILPGDVASIAVAIVTLSMAVSSQSERAYRLVMGPGEPETIDEDYSDAGGSVLIIGFGRVGQLVAQPLIAEGIAVTLLDHDADRIREAKRFGARVHFGDGTRPEVLDAAGAAGARVIVIATDDPDATLRITRIVRDRFSNASLMVRAHDRIHAVRLAGEGLPATAIMRETLLSALALGEATLHKLGYSMDDAQEVVSRVRETDGARLAEQIAAGRNAVARDDIVTAIAPEPLGAASDDADTARRRPNP
ncbi:Kef-type potassium/proton antiporter, CPA2 family [Roseovarius nanhaiticus]|uniref:Kef-type potassium/proton antiporter, CPA2 family n=1 Tax=Roseovarius nanhaiticus TaxID=573024 RepID=A0A1N7FRV6_9RHOB|nr:monovalent cation:proton antiporter-2 (CPA2) family protein [Roseovarius nanhaiticus]SEK47159.1 Kef-type potassium/proton antiporter, CPA2 family [Roseovarius nanhaiticus]SIS03051.1 Kef-type potassium/proton antiporter, CPA2 family [Roseovarius nanhaiticus]